MYIGKYYVLAHQCMYSHYLIALLEYHTDNLKIYIGYLPLLDPLHLCISSQVASCHPIRKP